MAKRSLPSRAPLHNSYDVVDIDIVPSWSLQKQQPQPQPHNHTTTQPHNNPTTQQPNNTTTQQHATTTTTTTTPTTTTTTITTTTTTPHHGWPSCRGPGSSAANQVLTLVWCLAGEATSKQEHCTKRYLVNNYIRLGRVTYSTVAVSRRPSSRWAADAAEVTADGGAVPHVSPTLAVGPSRCSAPQSRGAVAGSWRLWWSRGWGAGRGGPRLPGVLLRSMWSCSDKFQQSFDWRCLRSRSSTVVGHS